MQAVIAAAAAALDDTFMLGWSATNAWLAAACNISPHRIELNLLLGVWAGLSVGGVQGARAGYGRGVRWLGMLKSSTGHMTV